ncbi:MAG: DUF6903 family protein [Lachnospiraceae bacterium]|uniref:DUF6903 family protein n=1 Tax=Parablautia sp. Marseille-Q6255 TaxID=3039593 RepID=UPI0024BBEEC9|nr:hypothetical protein [Parablautia sp. Marseille-Q6255]
MDERMKSKLIALLAGIFFIICVALVIVGQRHIGPQGTLVMLAGLAGLILLLYCYNRKFK